MGQTWRVLDDEDPVRQPDQFQELVGDQHDADALVGQVADHPVDFFLGAGVDAARWVVEHEHARIARQPARQDDLLLIAAGQARARRVGLRRADPEAFDIVFGDLDLASRPPKTEPRRGPVAAAAKRDVPDDAEGRDHPLGEAFGWDIAETSRDRSADLGRAGRPAQERHSARGGRQHAGDHLAQARLARVEQAADADDLARADMEVDRFESAAQ